MKKHFALLIISISVFVSLSAQQSRDVLYLKNGSRIYGKLLEATDSLYKVETQDGSIFIYSLPEVEKFVHEAVPFDGRKKSGFGFGLEGGFLVGSQDKQYPSPFSFNGLAGYTINTKHSVSLGSGVEFIGEAFTPLFLEYKYYVQDRRATPFFFVRGGKLFCIGDKSESSSDINTYEPHDFKGGFSFTAGTGISWAKQDFETYLTFAYRYAETSYVQKNYSNYDATYKNKYNRLEVKLGFRF